MADLDVAAVLFDMDGTLVDSDSAVERAWRAWGAEFGVDGEAAITLAHGSPSEPTVRKLLAAAGEDEIVAAVGRQMALQYDDVGDIVPTPGALELIAALDRNGVPWAVFTSADKRLAEARLGAAGIVAPLLVTTDDVRAGKPDPEGWVRAAALVGVPPEKCLVVEDAEVGLRAARAAGAKTAALRGLAGDLPISSLSELIGALRLR
ncbi:HAD-IA family hydrolase [Actinoplanes sp. NPDC049265]|uniref:HAD-IA family hydrolase n=1 Tax=Actinoplanes sp. NPDC049265 TaxID=3363902 RepID=UPI0037152C78